MVNNVDNIIKIYDVYFVSIKDCFSKCRGWNSDWVDFSTICCITLDFKRQLITKMPEMNHGGPIENLGGGAGGGRRNSF